VSETAALLAFSWCRVRIVVHTVAAVHNLVVAADILDRVLSWCPVVAVHILVAVAGNLVVVAEILVTDFGRDLS